MNRPVMASRRPVERGEFSWIGMLLLLVAVSAVYLAYVWVPVYMLHLDVKRTARDFMNQAVHERDDAALVAGLCRKVGSLESRAAPAGEEQGERRPAVELAPEDVTWERDAEAKPPMLHVAFEYALEVRYPVLDKVQTITLGFDHTQDIAVPNWGTTR